MSIDTVVNPSGSELHSIMSRYLSLLSYGAMSGFGSTILIMGVRLGAPISRKTSSIFVRNVGIV